MEYLFLEHTFRWLVEGGVLLMVVPQERLDSAIPLLAGNFTGRVEVISVFCCAAQKSGRQQTSNAAKRWRIGASGPHCFGECIRACADGIVDGFPAGV
jgi:hypothetical protein